MSANQSRLTVWIDVFDAKGQQAEVLPTLTPPELVEAILQEFRELEYLSDTPTEYVLQHAESQTRLDDNTPIGKQLAKDARLMLIEREADLPANTRRPDRPAYLRDQSSGKTYKLHWLPAIIGRPDQKQADNEQLAIDLKSYSMGSRASRRHAQIIEKGGQYYIEGLSSNPTVIEDSSGKKVSLATNTHPLHNGDLIHLKNSAIAFKFIVRDQEMA
jgi:hypothetical protein